MNRTPRNLDEMERSGIESIEFRRPCFAAWQDEKEKRKSIQFLVIKGIDRGSHYLTHD